MNFSHEFRASNLQENGELLAAYLQSLPSPMDSYLEDNLDKSQIFSIMASDTHIGFLGVQGATLWFFYVVKSHTRHAQAIFEEATHKLNVKEVFFQTYDNLLVSLVMDWEFEKKKGAYFFEDTFHMKRPSLSFANTSFTQAEASDFSFIQQETNNFFDALDLSNGEIFMLHAGDDLLGCGISVRGRYFTDYTSIGMVTCTRFRKQGVGKLILWHLKEWCYEQGLIPIAGCWYYNTLSRKTLESAGLTPRARGMRAILLEKESIPERTGNPPGEEVTAP
ncbi:MAG: N-acetyltransferase GCN5 [Bacillota bacterium]|nr:MAG: N-acetyltransferase GCN5 [Bacillota bacterium]MBS3951041.1 hypothetical protein [Peptococcaceae bacterium]